MINIEVHEKAYFNSDSNRFYEGYHINNIRWNGFATPCFEKQVADIIANDCSTYDFKIGYDEEKDSYVVTEYEGINILNTYSFEKEIISTPDGRKEVYSLGAGYWTWISHTLDEVKKYKDAIILSNNTEIEKEESIDMNY